MEDFIYSLNATMPIFLVMAAGYFLRRTGLLNENFVTVANRFNFKVTLPILLFMQISAMDLQADFDPLYFFFCIGATLASILAIWLLSARLVKDRTQVGSFIQGAYRGSAAVLGVAFIQNIYGNAGLAPLMIVAGDHVVNDMAGDGEDSWKSTLERAGYPVTCHLKGLGEYPQVRQMFLAHLAKALECLKR